MAMNDTLSQQEPDRLLEASRQSLDQAVEYCFGVQEPDGHWTAEVSADATFTAQYVMFKYCIEGLSLDEDGEKIKKWLLSDQTEEGAWMLAPGQGLPGNISTTIEAYLALRILGTPKEHPQMIKARDFVQRAGGIEKARFFTRFFLATFGIVPWSAIPQMPAELILLPNWALINIYVLSSWSRSTLIPVLVVRHHEPVYALPNGQSPCNDFIDELWADPTNKQIPYAPPLWESLAGKEANLIEFGFSLLDKVVKSLGGLRRGALRQLALRRCIEWLLEHQEESGDWAGFFPPIHGSVWALLLEGFPLDDNRVRLGMEALERLAVDDSRGKWIQATVSPCWDTGLCVRALADAGVAKDPRVEQAVEWLKIRQLNHDYGDWRIYANTQTPGGWSFEYFNTFYPDVDDSAVVVMALAEQNPDCIDTPMITNCMEWILGMQNFNGGWGAFDCNNEATWLHNCPFSDMDSFVDPASADITGRMLECYGLLMANRKGRRVNPELRRKLHESAQKAIAYLDKEQESFGAWWGRWGNNYNYGTTNCLRGLAYFAQIYPDAKRIAAKAVQWLEDCQNDDGGWGETLLSYTHKHLAGRGPSTAAQTAWALDSLIRFRPASSPSLRNGAQWLVDNQVVIPENGIGASWGIDKYVGTGFPHVLYLGYPFYHHFFPIQALARFIKTTEEERARENQALQLVTKTTQDINRPSVLMIALGGREDLEPFLNIAKRLTDCRVRIATHRSHEAVVVQHGFEFFDIGGSPEEIKTLFDTEPLVQQGKTLGDSQRLLRNIYSRCWDAGLTEPMRTANGTGNLLSGDRRPFVFPIPLDDRPFVADVVVSAPTTTVHVHIAEMVQVPLVLVSTTPTLPTKEVQHALTMTENSMKGQGWWNALSFFLYDLFMWLALGRFFNSLRAKGFGMHSLDLVWATRDFAQAKIPYFGLWSSSVLPQPKDWNANAMVAGYSVSDDEKQYSPSQRLQSMLGSSNRTIAVNMEVGSVSDPKSFTNMLADALEQRDATAIVCGSLAAKLQDGAQISERIYAADSIPSEWLLKRVHGVVHNGSASQTAQVFRAGVPQVAIPRSRDQFLWASKVEELGVGPQPLKQSKLTTSSLATAIEELLSGKYRDSCAKLSSQVQADGNGANLAATEIERQAKRHSNMQWCSVLPSLPAYWKHRESGVKISGAAAAGLVFGEVMAWEDLDLVERFDWTGEWRQVGSSSWMQPFRMLYLLVVLVHEMLLAGFRWLSGDKSFPEADKQCLKMRSPVRRSRMRQAHFDWEMAERNASDSGALATVMIQRWNAAVAESRHRLFAGNTDPGRAQMVETKHAAFKTESRADSVLNSTDGEQSEDEKAL